MANPRILIISLSRSPQGLSKRRAKACSAYYLINNCLCDSNSPKSLRI